MKNVKFGLLVCLIAIAGTRPAQGSTAFRCASWLAGKVNPVTKAAGIFSPLGKRPQPRAPWRANLNLEELGVREVLTTVFGTVYVYDFDGVPIEGATVSVTPTGIGNPAGGGIVYDGSILTTDADGAAVFNFEALFDPSEELTDPSQPYDPFFNPYVYYYESEYFVDAQADGYSYSSLNVPVDATGGFADIGAILYLEALFNPGPGTGGPDFPSSPLPPPAPTNFFNGSLEAITAPIVVSTTAPQAGGLVAVYNGANVAPVFIGNPFPGQNGPNSSALGDLDGDGVLDLIVASGPGRSGGIAAFNGKDGTLIGFLPLLPGYIGGFTVAAGDFNHDGLAEIVVGTSTGVDGIGIFDPRVGAFTRIFSAFGGLPVGSNLALGDVNGDGTLDIIAGSKVGAAVRVFDGANGNILNTFFPYAGTGYTGALTVAAGDLDGDGTAEIVLAPVLPAAQGLFSVVDVNGTIKRHEFSFAGFPVGITVGTTFNRSTGRADILIGVDDPRGFGFIRRYDGLTFATTFVGPTFINYTQGVSIGGSVM